MDMDEELFFCFQILCDQSVVISTGGRVKDGTLMQVLCRRQVLPELSHNEIIYRYAVNWQGKLLCMLRFSNFVVCLKFVVSFLEADFVWSFLRVESVGLNGFNSGEFACWSSMSWVWQDLFFIVSVGCVRIVPQAFLDHLIVNFGEIQCESGWSLVCGCK
jgi:hypothetical protein